MSQQVMSQTPTAASAQSVEILLSRVRLLMIGLLIVMSIFTEPSSRPLAVLVIAALVGLNLRVYIHSIRPRSAAQLETGGAWVTAVDALATAATFVLFRNGPAAASGALLPSLVLELAVRYCTLGAMVGLAIIPIALLTQIAIALYMDPGGTVSPPLMMVWICFSLLAVGFGKVFREAEHGRLAAMRERERIAVGFRRTVDSIVSRAGLSVSDMTYQQITEALREACAADNRATAELSALIGELIRSSSGAWCGLTPREEEILTMMARGLTYSRIAAILSVSPSTVRNHAANIMQKLKVTGRDEAVRMAAERRIGLPASPPSRSREPAAGTGAGERTSR